MADFTLTPAPSPLAPLPEVVEARPAGRWLARRVRLVAMPQPILAPLKLPVMLMHGFGLMGGVWRPGALHEAAMRMRAHGVRAFAPNVIPYAPPARRAELWREALREVLETTGAPQAHLVAHSMGGLDARYLVSRLGAHEHVRSLITISTPHRGSSIAPFLLRRPKVVGVGLGRLARFLTRGIMGGGDAAFLEALEALCPDHLTDHFNPAVPDHPDVAYASIAGYAGPGTPVRMTPTLLPQAHFLYQMEGVNDGFVSVESAQWGAAHDFVPADHGQQIGLHAASRRFDVDRFYLSLALGLRRHEAE